ncbi:hypothetical protein AAMO2058_000753900 [Amorphochlora amoebiformis]
MKRICEIGADFENYSMGDDEVDWCDITKKGTDELMLCIVHKKHILKMESSISAKLWASMLSFRKHAWNNQKSPSKRGLRKAPDILVCCILSLLNRLKELGGCKQEGIFRESGNHKKAANLLIDLLYQAATPVLKVVSPRGLTWRKGYKILDFTDERSPVGVIFRPSKLKQGWICYEGKWAPYDESVVKAMPQKYVEKKLHVKPEYSHYECACVVKRILRLLPDTLFSSSLYRKFLQADTSGEVNFLIRKLPPSNVAILKDLFSVVREIESNSARTRMDKKSLSIVLSPGLLKHRERPSGTSMSEKEAMDGQEELKEAHKSMEHLISIIIDNYDKVFEKTTPEELAENSHSPQSERSPRFDTNRSPYLRTPFWASKTDAWNDGDEKHGPVDGKGSDIGNPINDAKSTPQSRPQSRPQSSHGFKPSGLRLTSLGMRSNLISPLSTGGNITKVGINLAAVEMPNALEGMGNPLLQRRPVDYQDPNSNIPPEGEDARNEMNEHVEDLILDLSQLQAKTGSKKASQIKPVVEHKERIERYSYTNVAIWVEQNKERFENEYAIWDKIEKSGWNLFSSRHRRFKGPVQKAIRNVMEGMSTFQASFSRDKEENFLRIRKAGPESTDHFRLAQNYFFGHGVNRDWTKAREHYKLAATFEAHAKALFCLGSMLKDGQGGTLDIASAKECYRLAAELGNRDARFWLGRLLEDEYLKYKNQDIMNQAIDSYIIAADFDAENPNDIPCPPAMVALAYTFENGKKYGVETPEEVDLRYNKAKHWFLKGIKLEHAGCHFNLARIYEGGYGGPKSEEKAMYHYECALNHGHIDAQASKGYLLVKQGQLEEGVNQLTCAAEKGSAEAMYHLGELAEKGTSVTKSLKIAFQNYRRASESGHAQAMVKHAHFLFSNLGTSGLLASPLTKRERCIEALKLYEKAGDKHEIGEALNCAGVMYEEGHGVEADEKRARYFYERAAQNGSGDGMVNLSIFYEFGKGGLKKDKKMALELLEKASLLGSFQAKVKMVKLGMDLEEGYNEGGII